MSGGTGGEQLHTGSHAQISGSGALTSVKSCRSFSRTTQSDFCPRIPQSLPVSHCRWFSLSEEGPVGFADGFRRGMGPRPVGILPLWCVADPSVFTVGSDRLCHGPLRRHVVIIPRTNVARIRGAIRVPCRGFGGTKGYGVLGGPTSVVVPSVLSRSVWHQGLHGHRLVRARGSRGARTRVSCWNSAQVLSVEAPMGRNLSGVSACPVIPTLWVSRRGAGAPERFRAAWHRSCTSVLTEEFGGVTTSDQPPSGGYRADGPPQIIGCAP